jgi:hypothetical protein|tara:strand:+ start:289 stop:786 length:498 start_codon:yes stop_codon:yes gene_type:complete
MKALFITLQELKRKSIIDGNVDTDKLIQFVEVAQDTIIQNYLGTKLYNTLQTQVINSTLTTVNTTLLNTYIKPMLIWYTQATYLPYAAYQISNGGVFKHNSENSTSVSESEITKLTRHATETADFYAKRFMDYMDDNSELYPDYTASQDGGMYPFRDVNFTGWVL